LVIIVYLSIVFV